MRHGFCEEKEPQKPRPLRQPVNLALYRELAKFRRTKSHHNIQPFPFPFFIKRVAVETLKRQVVNKYVSQAT